MQRHFAQCLRSRFGLAARRSGIDAEKKTVNLRDVEPGHITTESYDKLVLSPRGVSVRPPLHGIDLPGNARVIESHMERHGFHLALGDGVASFEKSKNGALTVKTQSYPADIEILALLASAVSGRTPSERASPTFSCILLLRDHYRAEAPLRLSFGRTLN